MLKLKWNEKLMKECFKKVQRIHQLFPDDTTKSTIALYQQLIDAESADADYSFVSGDSLEAKTPSIYDARARVKDFREIFTSYPEPIQNYMANVFTQVDVPFATSILLDDELETSYRRVSVETLIDQAYKVFGYFDSKYKETLDFIFENGLMLLTDDETLNNEVAADFFNGMAWGQVYHDDSIGTVEAFNHELTHMVETIKNPSLQILLYCLKMVEINSIFISNFTNMQLRGEALARGKQDIANETLIDDYNYFNSIKECFVAMGQLYGLSKKDEVTTDVIREFYKERYRIQYVSDVASVVGVPPVEDCISYAFSSLVSLHMMREYKMDEDKGIYLFNKSINSNAVDLITYLDSLGFDITDPEYSVDLILGRNAELNNEIRLIRKRNNE